jgi:glycosyltransferase involved in cell wall biosynthesis
MAVMNPVHRGLRVLHVAAGNLFGGVERMLLAIAEAQQPDDCVHDFALCFDGRVARELRERGGDPGVLGAVRFRRPDTVWRARRALRRMLAPRRYDAVVCHSPWPCALAAPVVRRAHVPLLMWVHDIPQVDAWPERRVRRYPPDRFICNSGFTADAVARWAPGVPRDVIYPPVLANPPLDPVERRRVRGAVGATERTAVIVLASRLERYKGHHVLLRAAVRLRGEFAIWIAGAPQRAHEARYLEELHQLAADPALRGRVRFLGDRPDVRRLIAAADIHCQPNIAPEPFGIAFVEALYARVPVVTTANGGAVEIVDEGSGVLLPDASEAALAEALQQLMDNRAVRQMLGAAGPARARRVSDPDVRLREICAVVRAQAAPVPAV